MLLNNGNLNTRQLLAGNPSGKKIAKIAVGTSDTPADPADTTLTGMLAKDITGVNYLPNGVVEFVSALESSDPGMTIREMGLIDDSGRLVHRKVIADYARVTGVINTLVYRIKLR